MSNPMMKCGHAANAKNALGKPCCVICAGINPGASVVDEAPPSLEGRMAKCSYSKGRDGKPCLSMKPSSPDLAFFESKPNEEYDRFYCGCWGWN